MPKLKQISFRAGIWTSDLRIANTSSTVLCSKPADIFERWENLKPQQLDQEIQKTYLLRFLGKSGCVSW